MRKRTSYNDYMSYYTATSEAQALNSYSLSRVGERGRRAAGRSADSRNLRPMAAQKRHMQKGGRPTGRKAKPSMSKKHAKKIYVPKKRKKVIYIKSVSNIKFFSWRLLVTLVAIFLGMVSTASSSAVLRKNNSELNAMRSQLIQMQDEEAVLRARISEEFDITQIERIATTRLNMRRPRAHQIVYIHLPKQDFVVHHGIAGSDDAPDSLWEVIGKMLNSAKTALFSILPS